jgi:arginyl-tRNA synthetase
MYEELKGAVKAAAKKLFDTDIEPELTRPEEKFGDYATNAALQLAKKTAAAPQQIARQLVDELKNTPGLAAAKAIYGLSSLQDQAGQGETIDQENYLGKAYADGNRKYEEDPAAKDEINQINVRIYDKSDTGINQLHQQGIKLSFDYFDKILNLLSISTDRRYLESETIDPGVKAVKDNLGKVFKASQGAIVYEGEKAGLHTHHGQRTK